MDDYGEETGLTREMKAAADAGPTRSDTDTKWEQHVDINDAGRYGGCEGKMQRAKLSTRPPKNAFKHSK